MGIAPIFRFNFNERRACLIGTGFWVTEHGHLVTAWHVVAENIGFNGVDDGPIFAIQTFGDRSTLVRSLRKSWKHDTFDLALSETVGLSIDSGPPTEPLPLTLEKVEIGNPLFSYAVLSSEQVFGHEQTSGATVARFHAEAHELELGVKFDVAFAVRINHGQVVDIFEKTRDSVMLPFPCIQTNILIYGANSGGPVFDIKGRVCAVNCSSYEGADIAFHVPVSGILELFARDIELIPEDPMLRLRSILELGLAHRVPFQPSVAKTLVPLWIRVILKPYHLWLDFKAHVRWRLLYLVKKGD